jgi:hypothetical protein
MIFRPLQPNNIRFYKAMSLGIGRVWALYSTKNTFQNCVHKNVIVGSVDRVAGIEIMCYWLDDPGRIALGFNTRSVKYHNGTEMK